MAQDVTKKVRMSRDRAHRLASLARQTGKTESELLREGIDLVEERTRQQAALEALAGMVGPDERYEKVRFRLR